MVIEIGGRTFFVTHNPADFDSRYPINLVGHVHEKWKFKQCEEDKRVTFINLSCDVWNFMPVGINEIMGEYEKWKN